ELDSTEAVQNTLAQILRHDDASNVRGVAADALGIRGADTLIQFLQQQVAEEKDLSVQLKIIYAIGKIGGPKADAVLVQLSESGDPPAIRGRAKAALIALRKGDQPAKKPAAGEGGF